jgi:peptide deformylase
MPPRLSEQAEDVEYEEEALEEAPERKGPSPEELRAWRAAAKRLVRQFPDPALRTAAAPVRHVDEDVQRLLERMADVMMTSHGVGLAAPQIGVLRRVLVYRVSEEQGVQALIDPEVLERSEETEIDTEGCLSLMGGELSIPVERHARVRIAALDRSGEPMEFEAEGFEARVIQHEIDHLDGVLIVDRAEGDERKQALRELRLQS